MHVPLEDAEDVTPGEEVEDGEEDCGFPLPLEPNPSFFQASFSLDDGKASALRSLDGPLAGNEEMTPGEEVEDGEEDCGSSLPIEPSPSCLKELFSLDSGNDSVL
jgi:hypothetical protein